LLRIILVVAVILSPAFAQVDISGVWTPRYHEDQQDRIPGPELGDYLGLPLNEAGWLSALSWDASRLTLPEQQCRVHAAPYTSDLVAIQFIAAAQFKTRSQNYTHPPCHSGHLSGGTLHRFWILGKLETEVMLD